MQKIKTKIIGCDKVSHLHAAGLVNIPESAFTAVCGRNSEKALFFAEKYNVKAFTNVTEMIEKSDVEMVTITTPHPAHALPSIEAMKAGAHVLVDKPLASSLADCDAMIQASRKFNRKLGMISQCRLYPPV